MKVSVGHYFRHDINKINYIRFVLSRYHGRRKGPDRLIRAYLIASQKQAWQARQAKTFFNVTCVLHESCKMLGCE